MSLSGQGFVIMVMGLAVVFTFLLVMVAVMSVTSRLFIRFAHWLPEDAPARPKASNGSAQESGALVAAIAGAITARRN